MFTTRNALTRDNINIKIWIERTENKEQAKDKQIIDSPIVTEDSVENVRRDESERYEDRFAIKTYKIEIWRLVARLWWFVGVDKG